MYIVINHVNNELLKTKGAMLDNWYHHTTLLYHNNKHPILFTDITQ